MKKLALMIVMTLAACGADGRGDVDETPDREVLELRLLDDPGVQAALPAELVERVRANPVEALAPDLLQSGAPKGAELEVSPHIDCSASSCAGEYCSCKRGAAPYCQRFATVGTLLDGAAYVACYTAYVSGCFSSYLACKFAALLD